MTQEIANYRPGATEVIENVSKTIVYEFDIASLHRNSLDRTLFRWSLVRRCWADWDNERLPGIPNTT